MTSYFPGDRDKESTHSPFSPCTNRVGCVRCWGNFAETNRLALNGLKLWSPVTRVSSVQLVWSPDPSTKYSYNEISARAKGKLAKGNNFTQARALECDGHLSQVAVVGYEYDLVLIIIHVDVWQAKWFKIMPANNLTL